MHKRALPLFSLFLLAACNPGDGTTAGATETTTSGESSSTSTDGTNPTTSGTTTTTETTGGSTSTGPVDTSTTTTGDTSTTTGGPATCMASGECDGGYCWADYVPESMGPGEFTCHDVCVDDQGQPGNAEDVWCIDDGSCCNADSTCDQMGYCRPGMTDTDTDTDTGTGTDTDTGTGTDTDTGTGTDTDTDTGGGVLPLIDITNLIVFADCMPLVPEDPVTASWTVNVDNTAGDVEVTAVLTKATLTYTPGMGEFVQGISADPTMVGPVAAMGMGMTMMTKTAALMDLPDECMRCGKPVALELTLDVDGQPAVVSAEVVLECAF